MTWIFRLCGPLAGLPEATLLTRAMMRFRGAPHEPLQDSCGVNASNLSSGGRACLVGFGCEGVGVEGILGQMTLCREVRLGRIHHDRCTASVNLVGR